MITKKTTNMITKNTNMNISFLTEKNINKKYTWRTSQNVVLSLKLLQCTVSQFHARGPGKSTEKKAKKTKISKDGESEAILASENRAKRVVMVRPRRERRHQQMGRGQEQTSPEESQVHGFRRPLFLLPFRYEIEMRCGCGGGGSRMVR